jgi:hypothetical protein
VKRLYKLATFTGPIEPSDPTAFMADRPSPGARLPASGDRGAGMRRAEAKAVGSLAHAGE